MFKKILIANRGEIAVRIMRTCREMGIAAAAVYSEADRGALHVQTADEAIAIGGSQPRESYLNIEKIIAAAKACGAEAIHPGYGFLAENGAFAERCESEGIRFIGPPAAAIRLLGDKTTARRMMLDREVPVIPGMTQPEADPANLAEAARKIGYPVLLKAAAGGGGKGMRIVANPENLKDAFDEATSEAKSAFGSGAVYLEKYLERPRHVEIQILADTHGHIVHLDERECSIQRRHQKIVEESPSPALNPALREAMGEAAVNAARAAGYVNAGTVEFLLDAAGRFYFLEVNTRLQVEHPVTEMVTGIDLVREQIRIAAGEPLAFRQEEIRPRGHAIECRIYAEDPEQGFLPSPGEILYLREPSGPGVRVDSGIYSGFKVPTAYDPILSKLVVHAGDRPAAIERMVRALSEYCVLGIRTPVDFLLEVILSEPFRRGETHTRLIDERFAGWKPSTSRADMACLAYAATRLSPRKAAAAGMGNEQDHFPSPWKTLGRWSL
ncbi:MAG: acetyl-CoA carboxylase biotin carboxylase subunit [Deltaproteobacteria bacterium]|nr:acetyl-CoA carboxylase biotin carboxylase subunit [Deltaproteobacteria bacterium]